MEITQFFTLDPAGDNNIVFTRDKASHFAKSVAGDFNPIHNVDAKRFCVPGDLLFALAVHQFGIAHQMKFEFLNMVDGTESLRFIGDASNRTLVGNSGKEYLSVSGIGKTMVDVSAINSLTESYVQFSGQTFPFVLVDLMKEKGVMINPARPLVIYKSMDLALDSLDFGTTQLELLGAELAVDGKKGEVMLEFELFEAARKIGRGSKQMLLGGLREYDQTVIDGLVSEYNEIKNNY